jgi:hypothetical protein
VAAALEICEKKSCDLQHVEAGGCGAFAMTAPARMRSDQARSSDAGLAQLGTSHELSVWRRLSAPTVGAASAESMQPSAAPRRCLQPTDASGTTPLPGRPVALHAASPARAVRCAGRAGSMPKKACRRAAHAALAPRAAAPQRAQPQGALRLLASQRCRWLRQRPLARMPLRGCCRYWLLPASLAHRPVSHRDRARDSERSRLLLRAAAPAPRHAGLRPQHSFGPGRSAAGAALHRTRRRRWILARARCRWAHSKVERDAHPQHLLPTWRSA